MRGTFYARSFRAVFVMTLRHAASAAKKTVLKHPQQNEVY